MTVNRRALITGAYGDIGRATVERANKAGWDLVISGRDSSKLQKVVSELSGSSKTVSFVGDVAHPDFAADVMSHARHELGGLDSIIHCAGVQESLPLKATNHHLIESILQTNVTSAILLAQSFRDKRLEKKHPSLVLISSIAGLIGHSSEAAYAASKAAIIGLVRSLAAELASQTIRVNAVAPGAISGQMTEQIRQRIGADAFSRLEHSHPLGLGSPTDVADAIIFLASEESNWITGVTLPVDGGYSSIRV